MADINQVITLGIGTPSSIKHFILLGLTPFAPEPIINTWTLTARDLVWDLETRDLIWDIKTRSLTWTVEDR